MWFQLTKWFEIRLLWRIYLEWNTKYMHRFVCFKYYIVIVNLGINSYSKGNSLKTIMKYVHFKNVSKDFMEWTVVIVAPFLLMVGNVNSYAKTVVLTYAIMFMDVLIQKLVNITSISMYIFFPFRLLSHSYQTVYIWNLSRQLLRKTKCCFALRYASFNNISKRTISIMTI